MCIVCMLAPDVDTLAPTMCPLHAQVTPTHTRATSDAGVVSHKAHDDWSRSTVASVQLVTHAVNVISELA